jgi:hypothetical protein
MKNPNNALHDAHLKKWISGSIFSLGSFAATMQAFAVARSLWQPLATGAGLQKSTSWRG